MDSTIEVASSAIKALERLSTRNRSAIVELLKKNSTNWRISLTHSLKKIAKNIFSRSSSSHLLGQLLVRDSNLSEEQLELALLMQIRFPLLLGQVLRYLEYVSIPDIQKSIAFQKNLS